MTAQIAKPSFISRIFSLSDRTIAAILATLPSDIRAIAARNGESPARDLIVAIRENARRARCSAEDVFALQADLVPAFSSED